MLEFPTFPGDKWLKLKAAFNMKWSQIGYQEESEFLTQWKQKIQGAAAENFKSYRNDNLTLKEISWKFTNLYGSISNQNEHIIIKHKSIGMIQDLGNAEKPIPEDTRTPRGAKKQNSP